MKIIKEQPDHIHDVPVYYFYERGIAFQKQCTGGFSLKKGCATSKMMKQIELEKAQQLIREKGGLNRIEELGLLQAHGRVLAKDVFAPLDLPPFNRSPLDGYALKAADTGGAGTASPVSLKIIDTIFAGKRSEQKVAAGSAVRLMTGSPIPDGADCVIRQEDTRVEKDRVQILRELDRWDNFCFKGEIFEKGDLVLAGGSLLKATEIGVLAGLGITMVNVYQRPAAAVISTGDELVEPGRGLAPGRIYNSNFYTIACRLRESGVDVVPTGIIGDDREAIAKTILEIVDQVDFIVTTGGVSVGKKDVMKEVMIGLGAEMIFWKVNIKPGSPALFSVLSGKPVISLSGNPLAASVSFDLLLFPFLKEITHNRSLERETLPAVLQNDFRKKSPVRRFLRGRLAKDKDGQTVVSLIEREQSPGNLKSALHGDCYIEVKKGSPGLKQGETVNVIV